VNVVSEAGTQSGQAGGQQAMRRKFKCEQLFQKKGVLLIDGLLSVIYFRDI